MATDTTTDSIGSQFSNLLKALTDNPLASVITVVALVLVMK